MDKNKGIRYAAGACFAGLAVLESISLVQSNSFSIWTLLSFAGFAIIAVSMFASMTTLTAVGAGVLGISVLGVFISLIPVIIDWPLLDWPLKGFFLYLIFMVIYSVILLLVGLNKKSAKRLGIVAGATLVLYLLVRIILNLTEGGELGLSLTSLLYDLLMIGGAVLIGFAVDSIPAKAVSRQPAAPTANANISSSESSIERLTKLKELLTAELFPRKSSMLRRIKF